jgi:hypothetical protein
VPVSHEIDVTKGVVFTTWSGDVTLEEARSHLRQLRDDPDFLPSMGQLSDARDVTSTVPAEGIRELASNTPFGEGSRRAIVVTSDVVFGVSRMYELRQLEGGADVKLFRDIQEARAWLGLERAEG